MVIHSYPWYIADWRGSETRIRMTLEERAIYRDLLDHCWEQGSLPNDEQMLAKICSATPSEFKRAWPSVKKSFIEDGDRIRHAKVDAKRPEVIRLTEQRREAGKASAEARAKRASQRSSNERSTSVETSASTLLQPSSTTTSTTTITSNKNISPSPMANGGVVDLDPIPLSGRDGLFDIEPVVPKTSRPTVQRQWFEQWWESVWLKTGKGAAEKRFTQLVRDEATFTAVVKATKLQCPIILQRERQFQVHPAKWLNDRRWEDDPAVYQAQSQPVSPQYRETELW